MQTIDLHGNLDKYLFDKKRKIPKIHLESICKYTQGKKTCRYIMLGAKGFVCMKKSLVRTTLDDMVKNNKIIAQGDNCEGLGTYKK